jgi:hypothetical protein
VSDVVARLYLATYNFATYNFFNKVTLRSAKKSK